MGLGIGGGRKGTLVDVVVVLNYSEVDEALFFYYRVGEMGLWFSHVGPVVFRR